MSDARRVVAAAMGLPSELMAEDGTGAGEPDAAVIIDTDSFSSFREAFERWACPLRSEVGEGVAPEPGSAAGALSILERMRNPDATPYETVGTVTGRHSSALDEDSIPISAGGHILHVITPSAEGEDE
jgi:hypothetical protein